MNTIFALERIGCSVYGGAILILAEDEFNAKQVAVYYHGGTDNDWSAKPIELATMVAQERMLQGHNPW